MMFEFPQIARHVRQWRAERKRIATESIFYKLPIALQKDIGWPAASDQPLTGKARNAIHTRPTPG